MNEWVSENQLIVSNNNDVFKRKYAQWMFECRIDVTTKREEEEEVMRGSRDEYETDNKDVEEEIE